MQRLSCAEAGDRLLLNSFKPPRGLPGWGSLLLSSRTVSGRASRVGGEAAGGRLICTG